MEGDAVAAGVDVGRHDFDTLFKETLEQVGVKGGINCGKLHGIVGVGIDFILHIEVVEGCYHHERMRLVLDAWGGEGGALHDFLDFLPRYIVADGDFRVDDDAKVLGCHGVVARLRTHQAGVLDGNDLVLAGADSGDEHRLLYDLANSVANFDIIADVEGAHVGHHQTGYEVADDGGGAERGDDTDEDRHALEHLRVAVGQQGPYHDEHQRIEQDAQDVVGGLCPVGVEAAYLQVSRLYLTCKIADEPQQIAEAEPDGDNLEKLGDVVEDSYQDVLEGVPDVAQDGVCYRFRLREDGEQPGEGGKQQNEDDIVAQHLVERHDDDTLLVDVEELVVLEDDRLQAAYHSTNDRLLPAEEEAVGD